MDGVYCFYDFTPLFFNGKHENDWYIKGAGYSFGEFSDPVEFASFYAQSCVGAKSNDPNDGDYMNCMFIIAEDGRNAAAISQHPNDVFIPSEFEDATKILFIREGYKIKFVEFDNDGMRPSEDNIPDDSEWDFKAGNYRS